MKAKKSEKQKAKQLEIQDEQEYYDFEKKKKYERVLKNQQTLELMEQDRVNKLTDRLDIKAETNRHNLLR